MKEKMQKLLGTSLLIMAVSLLVAVVALPVQANNATKTTSQLCLNSSNSLNFNDYALRCYKRCTVDRYGRHCRTICN